MIRFIAYLLRWQLSTPVLWVCLYLLLPCMSELGATIVANFVGGCTFYYVDKLIFGRKKDDKQSKAKCK